MKELIRESMSRIVAFHDTSDGVAVTTTCQYPDNGFVTVVVRGGPSSFQVSDEGKALREMLNAAIEIPNPDATLRRALGGRFLEVERGRIFSRWIDLADLPAGIAAVANASQMATEWMYSHLKIQRQKDFKAEVRGFLESMFPGQKPRETKVVGDSNKAHKFDNLIQLGGGKQLIVDAVVHDANAINSSVVANMDVRKKDDHDVEQRIIYDDTEDWPVSDLNLLSVGATAIPFSKSPEVFRRFSHLH